MQEIKRKLKLRNVRSAQLPWLQNSHAKKEGEIVGMRFFIIESVYFYIEFLQIYKTKLLMHRTC